MAYGIQGLDISHNNSALKIVEVLTVKKGAIIEKDFDFFAITTNLNFKVYPMSNRKVKIDVIVSANFFGLGYIPSCTVIIFAIPNTIPKYGFQIGKFTSFPSYDRKTIEIPINYTVTITNRSSEKRFSNVIPPDFISMTFAGVMYIGKDGNTSPIDYYLDGRDLIMVNVANPFYQTPTIKYDGVLSIPYYKLPIVSEKYGININNEIGINSTYFELEYSESGYVTKDIPYKLDGKPVSFSDIIGSKNKSSYVQYEYGTNELNITDYNKIAIKNSVANGKFYKQFQIKTHNG